jgi:cytochrome b561
MSDTGRYNRLAMMLHWLVALLIIANVALIWTVDYVSDDDARVVIDTHKSIGITVLGLALLRLLWRAANRPPPLPTAYRPWERQTAHVAHVALYVLIVALPLSGWLHDSAWKDAATHPMYLFGLFEWPRVGLITAVDPAHKEVLHDQLGALHTWLGYILYGLFALHIIGAVKHQFLDKEAQFQRIVPWGRPPVTPP